jgi:hypothetical protein
MDEKIKKLYDELNERKEGLLEVFADEKEELLRLISGMGYNKMLNLTNYNDYTKIMNIAKEIEEIDVKLRTLRALVQ